MAVVLITGTSSGIGLATALHFARKGYEVYASLRRPETAQELVQTVAEEQLPVTLVTLDVDVDASVQQGIDSVLKKAGHIDVLVNNAGIAHSGAIEEVPLAIAKQIFETNYWGTIRLIQAVLPTMRARRSGSIVNVTSVAGRLALATHGHYCASKFALEAASELLAQEVCAFNIRVAIIEPGVVPTPIFAKGRQSREALPPNPISAYYADHLRRLRKLFQKQLQQPTPPTRVAEVIEHAVTTKHPQLRYVVGEDARILLKGRQQITDEEWVANGLPMSDEEYFDLMVKRYGKDMYR
ncbi:MAG TPA: SDR family oxidoreductase [Terriglobia bacterium]|nr:SDR family oxidoreductase [Terriglobia bacterium]